MNKNTRTKRIMALAMALVMVVSLLPLGVFAQAAEGTEIAPYYTVNWGGLGDGDYDYVYSMPYFYTNSNRFPSKDAIEAHVAEGKEITYDMLSILVPEYGTSNMDGIVAALKADFDKRPAGARHILFSPIGNLITEWTDDALYMENIVAMCDAWLTEFLTRYKAAGGLLDGIVLDVEYLSGYWFYIDDDFYCNIPGSANNKKIYWDIVENPNYATKMRPLLEKRGFTFWPTPDANRDAGDKSEIWTIQRWGSDKFAKDRAIWDDAYEELLTSYINAAVTDPLHAIYPEASVSDYRKMDSKTWYKTVGATGEIPYMNSIKVGDISTYNPGYAVRPFYGYANDGTCNTYQSMPSYNKAVYERTPFNMALYYVNLMKDALASTENGRVTAWNAEYNYNDRVGTISSTPYYSEMILHVGMMTKEAFLGYVPYNTPTEEDKAAQRDRHQVTNDLMSELTRVAGDKNRQVIQTPATWNGSYMLSGMEAFGRNIWRLTPDITKVTKENFLVDGEVPTFYVDGLTIKFPQGRIIEDGNISNIGTCGYWIETPADVLPVITAEENRYANNPAFLETFEAYKNDYFTTESVKPNTYWEVTGSGASIVYNSEKTNKYLSLTGDATVTSTKIPANVTAGDDYAKQQAWEVTATFLAGTYGEIKLFSCGENDGFKINGNQVYYYNAETAEYVAIADLTVGEGTYTFEREVNFNNFTSTYTVTAGETVYTAENIPMATVELPVAGISMSYTGTGAAVLLDDYKMYATGVTTVLELYDTTYGVEVEDITAVRTEETAYRLSWMNASSEAKKAVIDLPDGTTVEIEMAPGMDGVATGIYTPTEEAAIAVEVADTEIAAAEISTDTTWTSDYDSLGACIVGNKAYATLADGVAAAENGQVILLEDVVLSSALTIDKPIRFYNNGKTITTAANFSGEAAINVVAGGELTVDDNVALTASETAAIQVNGGHVHVNGGSISGVSGIVARGGHVEVTGGTITATSAAANKAAIVLDQGEEKTPVEISVTGGTLNGVNAFYQCNSTGTPSEDISATVTDATYTGTAVATELHYAVKTTEKGFYLHKHDAILLDAQEATCTEPGLTVGYRCDVCDEVYAAQEEIPALGHVLDAETNTCANCGVAWDCAITGHNWAATESTDVHGCTLCDATEAHTPAEAVRENETSATKTTTGSYEAVVYCSVCGEELSRTTVETPATTDAKLFFMAANDTGYIGSTWNCVMSKGDNILYLNVVDGYTKPINWNESSKRATAITEAEIPDSYVKFDYTGDIPTLTLHNANINNYMGLTVGEKANSTSATTTHTTWYNVVLEGENTITATSSGYSGLDFITSGKVTFSGDGSLTLSSNRNVGSNGAGAISSYGDITFDHVDISLILRDDYRQSNAISSLGGNIVIKGGSLDIFSCDYPNGHPNNGGNEVLKSAFYTTVGSLTIQDNAKVVVNASTYLTSPLVDVAGAVTITNSDILFALNNRGTGNAYVFNKAPVLNLDGDYTIQASANKATYNYTTDELSFTDLVTYTKENYAEAYATYRVFSVTHNHVEGELVKAYDPEYACSATYEADVKCTICGEVYKVVKTNTGAGHISGEAVRVDVTTADVDTAGTYYMVEYCTVCGVETDRSELFETPIATTAYVHFQGDHTTSALGSGNDWKLTVNKGEVKYLVNGQTDTADGYTEKWYTSKWTGEGAPADNYVKVDYTGDIPVVTLHNVTIDNIAGLAIGGYVYPREADAVAHKTNYKVVLEGTNTIKATQYGGLQFVTSGDVTITGTGSLVINTAMRTQSYGAMSTYGNLTFDNADITMNFSDATGYSHGISSHGGNILIKGGTLNIFGYDYASGHANDAGNNEVIKSAFYTTVGDLTIQDNAKVKVNTSVTGAFTLVDVAGEITIENSDVLLAINKSSNVVFNKAPELKYAGGYTAEAATVNATFNPDTEELTLNSMNPYDPAAYATYHVFSVTHNHVEGELVKAYDADPVCAATYKADVACAICGEVYQVEKTNEAAGHTPGEPVREDVTTSNATTAGTYYMVEYCTVCGVETDRSELFETPIATTAYVHFQGDHTTSALGSGNDWKLTVNKGEVKYLVNGQTDTADGYTEKWYTSKWTGEGAPADNYVKVDYTGDIPVVTLHNVTIDNIAGLAIGGYVYPREADAVAHKTNYKVVLEGTNTIKATQYGGLQFVTSGDVTITGTGSLVINTAMRTQSYGAMSTYGNLTFDNADITMNFSDATGYSHGISSHGGNILIKGGTLNIFGYDYASGHANDAGNNEVIKSAFYTTVGDLTIQDNAKVKVNTSVTGAFTLVDVAGEITIENSDVLLAINKSSNVVFNKAPELKYAGGYTAEAATVNATFNPDTEELTLNSMNPYDPAAYATYHVFSVTHNHVAGEELGVVTSIDCADSYVARVACTICGEEFETVKAKEATGEHTHAPAVRENEIAATNSAAGSYESVVYCTECGAEVSRETVEIQKLTSPNLYYQSNSDTGPVGNSTKVTLTKGNTIYLTNGQYDATEGYADKWYTKVWDGESELTTNYIKLDYTGDKPVITLYNVTIDNYTGLAFGSAYGYSSASSTDADYELVLVGENKITASNWGGLQFVTNGNVTISGPGSLTVNSGLRGNALKYGAISNYGNLIFDNTDVSVTMTYTGDYRAGAIVSINGDITVQGTELYAAATNNNTYKGGSMLNAAGNILIEDRSEVTVIGSSSTEPLVKATTFTIDDSDVELAATRADAMLFNETLVPEIDPDGYTVLASATKPTWDGTTLTPADVAGYDEANAASYYYFAMTHNHVEGELVENLAPEHACSESYMAVVRCTVCGETFQIEKANDAAPHTPGTAVRVDNNPATSTTPGSYDMVVSCTECGKELSRTTVETPATTSAIIYYQANSSTGNIGSGWRLVVNKGAVSYLYNYLDQTDNRWYTDKWTAEGTPEDNYIKVDYTGDIPVVTFHGVKIHNHLGLAIGNNWGPNTAYAEAHKTNYKLVFEGENTITATGNGGLTFVTSGDVTFSGEGSLTINTNLATKDFAAMTTYGDLIFDNANLTMNFSEEYRKSHAIGTFGGDIIIKGGNINLFAYDDPTTDPVQGNRCGETIYTAFFAKKANGVGGNMIIQDNANVKIVASSIQSYVIDLEGELTISDSNVEVGIFELNDYTIGLTNAKVNLNLSENYKAVAAEKQATFDGANMSIDDVEAYDAANLATYNYFKVMKLVDHEHTVVTDAAVAPSCTETGLTEGTHCSVCGEILTAQEEVAATGHTEVTTASRVPTCTEPGLTEGVNCSVCGEILVAQEVIEAYGHTEVVTPGKDATCSETGLTEGSHCSVCGAVVYPQLTIPTTEHTLVQVEAKDPTCTEVGHNAYEYCSVCDYTTYEEIPMVAHTEKYVDNEDGTHDIICDVCEAVLTDNEAHNYVDGTCACGAKEQTGPVLVPTLTFAQIGMSLQDYIGLQIAVQKKKINNKVYDRVYLEYTQTTPSGISTSDVAEFTMENSSIVVAEIPVVSWSMSDEITVTVFYEYQGVTYQGETRTTSVRAQCMQRINDNTDAKAVCIAMLNYGAAVQDVKNHEDAQPEYLANYYLTEEQKIMPSFEELNITGTKTIPSGSLKPSAGLSLGDKVKMEFAVRNTDMSGYEVRYSVNGVEQDPITSDKFVTVTAGSVTLCGPSISVAPLNMRTEYRLAFHDAETGEKVYGDIICSVAAFAASHENTVNKPIVIAMMAYGDAVVALQNASK